MLTYMQLQCRYFPRFHKHDKIMNKKRLNKNEKHSEFSSTIKDFTFFFSVGKLFFNKISTLLLYILIYDRQ